MKLTDLLLEIDFNKYDKESDLLSKELDTNFGGSPYVSMGDYAGGREDNDPLKGKAYGKVTFRVKDEFEQSDWNKIISFIKSKGLEITQDSNYYENDPGEREYFPSVKFHFNQKES
jgi:hypothetical protein